MGRTMKTLAWYCIVYSIFSIAAVILVIGEPVEPLQTWRAVIEIVLIMPLVFLAVLVIRNPR